ncbi:adenosylcobinamide-GDP ribazoletransferase [Roseovarius sp. LXJ103]|uniref:adenosylcobinamide-GDP ribazoletransferase n=1 Tax=Roseovarius carneus TaxID=2853164 RepID=UPI000D603A2E|nr:adenosylcobinamide-GDP ribazoletransferase [Roseovarius carneus]MBZ8118918.1 adenosylcobinamide-GDP ribazoletransferase [Roseovarius carneus]PWE35425.1 adenosylcobinamide-GDP ribazoletransferase [Pelagicola sp. LXJ1103]
MAKNDTSFDPADVLAALQLLTRLPIPGAHMRGAAAAWAYPLAGAVVGALGGVAGVLALWLGLPAALAALIALAAQVIVTGALHEDGLADCADGFWGGWTRERRLEIMKDSQIGSYGVIALVLSLAARGGALWLLFEAGPGTAMAAMVAVGMVSRSVMPALMWALPHARASGLSASVGAAPKGAVIAAAGLATLGALALLGPSALGVLIGAGLAALGLSLIARAKISGQTGDVLGAAQQVAEVTALLILIT